MSSTIAGLNSFLSPRSMNKLNFRHFLYVACVNHSLTVHYETFVNDPIEGNKQTVTRLDLSDLVESCIWRQFKGVDVCISMLDQQLHQIDTTSHGVDRRTK